MIKATQENIRGLAGQRDLVVEFTRGTGLGNRLFPFARAVLAANANPNYRMIHPRFFNLRMATLLKGGVPMKNLLRKTFLFDNFCRLPEEPYYASRDTVIFSGDGDHFRDIAGAAADIRKTLSTRMKPRVYYQQMVLPQLPARPFVGVNIRLGNDFKTAHSRDDFRRLGGVKTPLKWFVNSISQINEHFPDKFNFVCVSDGDLTKYEGGFFARTPNLSILQTKYAITDLMALSNASFILASGGSSFSAWAAYLAECSCASISGQSLDWFGLTAASPDRNCCFEYWEDVPEELLKLLSSLPS